MDLAFFVLSAFSEEFGHIFRAPERFFGLGFGPLKRVGGGRFGQSSTETRGSKTDWD